jgi:hypothetical protein
MWHVLALRDKLAGADNEKALAPGLASGLTSLKRTVEQKLAQGHDRVLEQENSDER